MIYPSMNVRLSKHGNQEMELRGVNLTDNYQDGQMQSCRNISTDRYPYITTRSKMEIVDAGIPDGSDGGEAYQAMSIFAWEKLFVVSNEPAENGGYKCYYGGEYCGNAANLDLPKQYAVVNSKLVMWPDMVYFNLYDKEMAAYPLTTAPLLHTVTSGNVVFRKAVEN